MAAARGTPGLAEGRPEGSTPGALRHTVLVAFLSETDASSSAETSTETLPETVGVRVFAGGRSPPPRPPRPPGTRERRHRQPRRGPCYLQASPGPSPRPRRFSSPYLAPLDRLSNREPKRSRDKEKFTEDSETNRRPGPRFVLADLARPPLRADGAVTAFSGSNPPLELMNNQPGLLGRGAALMNNSSALRADSRVHPLPAS